MGLEDLALFRSIPECLVLYPCDAVSTEKAVQLAANYKHTAYIRTSRPDTPVIYKNEEHFEIGKCKIVKSFDHPCIVIVAAGVTLHEALKASSDLEKENYHLLVIDVFSVKPIDSVTILEMA
jgi:transketolase